ncbi:carbon storage regulator CsrA [Marinicrinis lubricantis]|uniref:Translational regulator CsrA n=1 Tax=Marinicrinis lubricantis TaxID=2086470 RepID=A0ABW1IT72_9BACL
MLILSRKKGEAVMIGEDIEIMISNVEGDIVKIGINAPKSISVYRKEVYESIQKSNREAVDSQISTSDLVGMLKKGENRIK